MKPNQNVTGDGCQVTRPERGQPCPRFLFVLVLVLVLVLDSSAQVATNRITVSLTVTNGTTNGMYFSLNGDTRTFTNQIFNAATMVETNATFGGSASNLFAQLALQPFTACTPPLNFTGSNFNLTLSSGYPANAAISPGWALLTFSTQQVSSMFALRLPIDGEPSTPFRIAQASNTVFMINEWSPIQIGFSTAATNMGIVFYPAENSIVIGNTIGQGLPAINTPNSFIIGGMSNSAYAPFNGGIIGGTSNAINPNTMEVADGADGTVIIGGDFNTVEYYGSSQYEHYDTILGGTSNRTGGINCGIIGGFLVRQGIFNSGSGEGGEFQPVNAVGIGVDVLQTNSYQLTASDGHGGTFAGKTNGVALFNYQNGFGINTNDPAGYALNVHGQIHADGGFVGPIQGGVASDAFGNTVGGTGALTNNQIGTGNSTWGFQCMALNTIGSANDVSGYQAMANATNGSDNTVHGYGALFEALSPHLNTVLGVDALDQAVNPTNNVAIGYQAGHNYTGTESNNIVIASPGVAGESKTIRIGEAANQTTAILAGKLWLSDLTVSNRLDANLATLMYNGNNIVVWDAGLFRDPAGQGSGDFNNHQLAVGGVVDFDWAARAGYGGQWTFTNLTGNLLYNTGGISTTATNSFYTMATTGFTNAAGFNLTVCGLTGISIFQSNQVSHVAFSRGTVTTAEDVTLNPNEVLVGTSCAALQIKQ